MCVITKTDELYGECCHVIYDHIGLVLAQLMVILVLC